MNSLYSRTQRQQQQQPQPQQQERLGDHETATTIIPTYIIMATTKQQIG